MGLLRILQVNYLLLLFANVWFYIAIRGQTELGGCQNFNQKIVFGRQDMPILKKRMLDPESYKKLYPMSVLKHINGSFVP